MLSEVELRQHGYCLNFGVVRNKHAKAIPKISITMLVFQTAEKALVFFPAVF